MKADEIKKIANDYKMYDRNAKLVDVVNSTTNYNDPFEWDYLPTITRDGVKELHKGSLVKMDGRTEHRYDYSVNYRII